MPGRQDVLLRGQPEPAPEGITHGIQLTAANTGYASGTSFVTWGGSDSDQTNDWQFTNMRFPPPGGPGYYSFGGDGDTFTNCSFEAGVLFAVSDALTLVNCTFNGGLSFSSCDGVSVTGCRVLNGSDLVHITGDQPGRSQCHDITITETLIHQPAAVPAAHTDGIQIRGVDGLTLDRCRIDMGPWFQVGGQDVLNAAVFPEPANGGNHDLTVTNCYLNGGGNTVYLTTVTGVNAWTGNQFGSDQQYGRVLNPGGIVPTAWTANTVAGTGAVVPYN